MSKHKHERPSQERIYEAALTEFAEFGMAGARVDRIARRSGVNKAMIYYHFGSKQSLYESVVRGIAEDAIAGVGNAIKRAGNLEEALLAIATFHVGGFTRGKEFIRILLHEIAAGGESFKSVIPKLDGKDELRTIITDLIEAGKREGVYRDIDIRHAVISFAGMSAFYLIMSPMANRVWGIEDETEFRDQRPQAIVDLFMEGIKTR